MGIILKCFIKLEIQLVSYKQTIEFTYVLFWYMFYQIIVCFLGEVGGGWVIIVFMNKFNFLYCLPGVILSKEIRENLT